MKKFCAILLVLSQAHLIKFNLKALLTFLFLTVLQFHYCSAVFGQSKTYSQEEAENILCGCNQLFVANYNFLNDYNEPSTLKEAFEDLYYETHLNYDQIDSVNNLCKRLLQISDSSYHPSQNFNEDRPARLNFIQDIEREYYPLLDSLALKPCKEDPLVYMTCSLCDVILQEDDYLFSQFSLDSNLAQHLQAKYQLQGYPSRRWQDLKSLCYDAKRKGMVDSDIGLAQILSTSNIPWWNYRSSYQYVNTQSWMYDYMVPFSFYSALGLQPTSPSFPKQDSYDQFVSKNTPSNQGIAVIDTPKLEDLKTWLNHQTTAIKKSWFDVNIVGQQYLRNLLHIHHYNQNELLGANFWKVQSSNKSRYFLSSESFSLIPDSLNKESTLWQFKDMNPHYGFGGYLVHESDTLFSLTLHMNEYNPYFSIYDILSFDSLEYSSLIYDSSGYAKFKVKVWQRLPPKYRYQKGVKDIILMRRYLMSYLNYEMTGYVRLY